VRPNLFDDLSMIRMGREADDVTQIMHAKGDFRVATGSPALALGFTNFPMDQFGVKKPALKAVANKAMNKGTGARGLRSIIEEVMTDIMFELPEQSPGSRFEITEAVVQGREKLFKLPANEPKAKTA